MGKLRFQDKVVWLTGASSGIGEQLAYEFSREGAKLILSARNEDKLQMVNQQLPLNPGSAKILTIDLEEMDQLQSKAKTALSLFGKVDYLVNNAGLAVKDLAANTKLKVDEKLMKVNYFAPVTLSKLLLPHFVERETGHIVVTSSLSGKYGVPKLAAYAASKHALHGFFESLRSEIGKSPVAITIVVPGIVKTDITRHAVTGDGSNYGKFERSFENAYPPEKAAKKIVRAIYKKKEEVFVGGGEGFTLLLNRISPWLMRRFIRSHPVKKLRKITGWFSKSLVTTYLFL